jgi:cysteine sulfinate desulfinase/cysteine desulfurase-like protein
MIYTDNAATKRLSDTALEHMLPFLQVLYGNVLSAYSFGANPSFDLGLINAC